MQILQDYINGYLSESKKSPDKLAEESDLSRITIFRAKRGEDLLMSNARKIVNAVGKPLIIHPEVQENQQ